jgi:hypothetical protein
MEVQDNEALVEMTQPELFLLMTSEQLPNFWEGKKISLRNYFSINFRIFRKVIKKNCGIIFPNFGLFFFGLEFQVLKVNAS